MDIIDKKIVKLNYKGTLEDGTVFDSSEGKEPLEFMYGANMIIPGLEEGIKGLKIGDKKTVEVKADKAYGPRMDEAMQEVPKDQFPADIKLELGMQLAAQGPQGVIPVTVIEIKESSVIVDFNHPLAGKNLVFDIEVVEVREPTKEEIEHGHSHSTGHSHDKTEDDCCGGDCKDAEKCQNGKDKDKK